MRLKEVYRIVTTLASNFKIRGIFIGWQKLKRVIIPSSTADVEKRKHSLFLVILNSKVILEWHLTIKYVNL